MSDTDCQTPKNDLNRDWPKPAPATGEWATTARGDGDCAIFEAESKQLIGVGATVKQTINICLAHNAAIAAEREKVDELKGWKQSQMEVERQWDAQAVGKELGLTLGSSIRPQILPAIQQLREQLAEVEDHNIRGTIHPEALAKHIAAATKPLVEALECIKNVYALDEAKALARHALAKHREGKP